MSVSPSVIYLEPDDEVTSVVRRLRASDAGPVILVAPGRSRATSSVVALRLLARVAEGEGRSVTLVGDALTRSLAADAGLAAFGTLDEARSGAAPAPETGEARHAAISVVRGPATDATAPTLADVAAAAPPRPAGPSSAGPDDVTRSRPAVREVPVQPRRHPPQSKRRRVVPGPAAARIGRDGWVPIAFLGALAVVLLVGVVVAGTMLPAATVTIVPRTDTIGPVDYTIELPDAERERGVVTATREVVASGTYEIEESASGSVVFFNWTFFPVEVPAGTFVAAGEQAFATQAAITVPRGRLTGQGTIAAGDAEVAVVAAAPGEAANVAAEAINTVVSESIDARLRGFPENPQPRVLNPEPTSGGAIESGPEFTQEDVDAAVAALREELRRMAADALASVDDEGRIVVETPAAEPSVQVPDDLVGSRDQERVEIGGELAWEVITADVADVEAEALKRLRTDADLLSPGHELVEGTETASIGEPVLVDGVLTVPVQAQALSTAAIDRATVLERVFGRTAEAAEAALADLGRASVTLWPGWVQRVPDRDWRVEVVIEAPEGEEA